MRPVSPPARHPRRRSSRSISTVRHSSSRSLATSSPAAAPVSSLHPSPGTAFRACAGYRRMIEASAAGRAGTPDEVGTVGALLMGAEGAFITGSDFLMDGGVTAAYWFGGLAQK